MKKIQLFPYGRPVTGKDLLGREKDIKRILMDLMGGQHLLLPGSRRTGKSSVVLETLHRLSKQGYLTAYIDISRVNTKSELARFIVAAPFVVKNRPLSDLMRSVKAKIKDMLRFKEFKMIYEDFEVVATVRDPAADEDEQLNDALEFLEQYARKKKKDLFCAFDEFGEVSVIDSHLIKKMRAVFQHHKKCRYLFTGSKESILKDIFSNPKEPFFGFTKQIELSPIDDATFGRYIHDKFHEASIKIDILDAESFSAWVNRHPFYTMILANAVYEYAALSDKSHITQEELKAGYAKAFLQLKSQHESLWDELGKSSRFLRQVCYYVALHSSGENQEEGIFSKGGLKQFAESAHIAQALKQLEHKGIIRKERPGYYVFENNFFKDFVLSLFHPETLRDLEPFTGQIKA